MSQHEMRHARALNPMLYTPVAEPLEARRLLAGDVAASADEVLRAMAADPMLLVVEHPDDRRDHRAGADVGWMGVATFSGAGPVGRAESSSARAGAASDRPNEDRGDKNVKRTPAIKVASSSSELNGPFAGGIGDPSGNPQIEDLEQTTRGGSEDDGAARGGACPICR